MSCKFCGDTKRIQIVSPVSDHAWADCFCVKLGTHLAAEIHQNGVLGLRLMRYENAMREFVGRVDKGEVRSKRTYAKFKELLK